MHKRVAFYARVSTDGQTCDNQLAELERVAELSGWDVVDRYIDAGVSGAKGRDRRPMFDALARDAVRRKFDMVAVWSVDRLGRSLRDLVSFVTELDAAKVDLYLHQQGMDTTTPTGRAMFQMCGVFAEFERSMIRERVFAGLERARSQGRKLGRPRLANHKRKEIRQYRELGWGKKKIARQLSCGVGTVSRVLADYE